MNDVSPPDDATALCLACGMCCDGSLFGVVTLEPEDRRRLADAGLQISGPVRQPCPFFASSRCSVYDIRPVRCGEFRCKALRAVESGELPLSSALDLVDDARAQIAEISRELPTDTPMARVGEMLPRPGEPLSPGKAMLMTRYVAFRAFVERHFLDERKHVVQRAPVSRP